MSDSTGKGIPIYRDLVSRKIVSAGDLGKNETDWYPANPTAKRLWACAEILRDINDLLEDGANAKNSGKKKRKAKIIAGYIHSLAKATNGLIKTIIGEKAKLIQFDKSDLEQVQRIQKDFAAFVPFEWGQELAKYRNKLTAHFDDSFWPDQAASMLESIPIGKLGQWLHVCLQVVLDLTNLNIYSWSCDTKRKGYFRIMANDPFLVTIKLGETEEVPDQLVGVDVAAESPRNTIAELAAKSVHLSQWMFKKGQQRIVNLQKGPKDSWRTFSDLKDIWAQGNITRLSHNTGKPAWNE